MSPRSLIVAAKIKKGIKWADAARALGKSKEWVTAGLLGQMTFTVAAGSASVYQGVTGSPYRR